MIIGGAGGMAWTGVGGSIPGWRESYLHGIAIGENDLTQSAIVKYSVSVRVKSVASAWVTITDVTNFSVNADDAGGSNASLTIGNRETWSTKGTLHNGLLSPSDRTIQILCTMAADGTMASAVAFTGNITSYSESIGRSGQSISISCKSLMERLSTEAVTEVDAENKTKYLTLFEYAQDFNIPGPLLLFFEDAEQRQYFYFSNFTVFIRALFGWTARISAFQSGSIVQERSAAQSSALAAVTDSIAVSETRSVAAAAYNTIRLNSYYTGATIRAEASDAADVALRGKIYAPNLLYSQELSIAELETQANYAISEQLLGKITAQVRFNPLLMVGAVINFTGSEMNVSGTGIITAIAHNYTAGNASTSITMRVTEAGT